MKLACLCQKGVEFQLYYWINFENIHVPWVNVWAAFMNCCISVHALLELWVHQRRNYFYSVGGGNGAKVVLRWFTSIFSSQLKWKLHPLHPHTKQVKLYAWFCHGSYHFRCSLQGKTHISPQKQQFGYVGFIVNLTHPYWNQLIDSPVLHFVVQKHTISNKKA